MVGSPQKRGGIPREQGGSPRLLGEGDNRLDPLEEGTLPLLGAEGSPGRHPLRGREGSLGHLPLAGDSLGHRQEGGNPAIIKKA